MTTRNGTNRYAIREQTPGRFTARWYDDAGNRQSKTFPSRTDAKRFLDNIKSDRNRGDYIDPKDAQRSVEAVAEMWLESKNLRPKTRRGYEAILKFQIYPTFRRTPIGSITTMDLVSWIADLSRSKPTGRGLAPQSVSNTVSVMKQILNTAIRARYLRGNPVAGLTREDFPKPTHEEMLFLTVAEVHACADAMLSLVTPASTSSDHSSDHATHTLAASSVPAPRKKPGRRRTVNAVLSGERAASYQLMVRFAAQTGMRAGEIVGLRWGNVDLLRGRITVAESITARAIGDYVINPPKNGKTRVVPIDPTLTQQLRDHAATLSVERFTPDCYVWPSPRPGVLPTEPMSWSQDFYLPYWKAAVRAAGLKPMLRFHDLRHTCASLLIAANIPAKAIQEHLGHSSYQITMDRYGHLYADASDAVTAAMGAAFAGPAEAQSAPSTQAGNVTPLRGSGVG